MPHRQTDKSITASSRLRLLRRLRFSLPATLAFALFCFARPARANEGGWNFETYHVEIIVAIDAPGGLAEQLAAELPTYLGRRIYAALVPAWSCDVRLAAGPERDRVFARIADASDAPPPEFPADKDKLILTTVRWAPEGIAVTAREFDRFVQRWGMPIHRESRQESSLPEQLFALVWETFSPLAQLELDPKDSHRVVLEPRGALLPRRGGAGPWAQVGDVFLPILRRTTRGGQLEKGGIQIVPWTYVEATELKGNTIVGRIQSANRRPFAARRHGRTEQIAIALRADPDTTMLRLHSRTTASKPLVGYEVFAQQPGEEALARIGVTNTAGQLPISPGKTRIQFLVVKHGGQLFARVPIVAGAERRLDVPLPDDDARMAAEARLAAVREDLVDVVARRNILMARARQKIKKKDFAAAQDLLRSLDDLPARPQFNLTLSTAARSLRSDDPQMQRRIDQLFEATRTLLTQYLDLRPISQLHDELRDAQTKGEQKTSGARSASKS